METRICPNCGQANHSADSRDVWKCHTCGGPVKREVASCDNCGYPIGDASVCPRCHQCVP